MNTIPVAESTFNGVAQYSRIHNISMEATISKGLALLVLDGDNKKRKLDAAYAFIDTIPAKGGKEVPGDERGVDALVDEKYAE